MKGKRITTDEIARMVEKEFATLRKEMVTKEDLKPLATAKELLSVRDELLGKIESSISPLHERAHVHVSWLKLLEQRVERLEGKRRRAA